MRLGATRQDEFEINVISLIDVMLTLLMFFVMTTTFVQHSSMKVALPKASETQQEVNHDALIIMIGSDSRFYVDNNEVLNPNVDSLKQAIVHVAGDDHDRPVILRADAIVGAPFISARGINRVGRRQRRSVSSRAYRGTRAAACEQQGERKCEQEPQREMVHMSVPSEPLIMRCQAGFSKIRAQAVWMRSDSVVAAG